jgi:ubiquinol-cytochrome c reductase cytochrome b subunit
MRIFKSYPFLKLVNSYIVDAPVPSNINYLWNFGSLLALCLVVQIITGVTLAMHYNPSVLEAFNSVEHIMRDVNNGWLVRYLHSNTASAFFFLVYLHMGRGLYYGSYRNPRALTWTIGTIIFLLMIVTGFLGYVLPYSQTSLWGATVITNLMSAIPWIGQDLVEFIWGGFSVNNATLNRFFALHFVLPFVLAALVLMHLIALHDTAGANNPLGISANNDRLSFAPYYLFKDLITIFIFILVLSTFVFLMPNVLGDTDNYIMGNPMQTPSSIVPEWYLLPFYAILRSIPNKLLGVIAMLAAILILLAMPFTDLGKSRGLQFKPLSKVSFYLFIAIFFILMILGAKHVESPYIEFGQISTVIYFSYFLLLVPFMSLLENSLGELNNSNSELKYLNKFPGELSLEFYPVNLFNGHIGLSGLEIGGKRSFSTTSRRLTDAPGDGQDPLDDETSEEYKAVEDRFEAQRAKDEIIRCKEELASMGDKSTSEKIQYTQGMITGDMRYEDIPVTPESVNGIMNDLMNDLEIAEQEAEDNINDANAKITRLNNEANSRRR